MAEADAGKLDSLLRGQGGRRIGAAGGSYGGGMSMALGALKDRKMLLDYSLVPWSDAMLAELGDELRPFAVGKGTIRFPADEPIPLELVTRIVEVRNREVADELRAAQG